MIAVTENAIKELKKVKKEQELSDDTFVRISITSGGCSGFQYNLNFKSADDFDSTQDTKAEQGGLTFVVDKKSDLYLEGTTLDFYSDLDRRGFTFDNPNSIKNCGCGQSFQA